MIDRSAIALLGKFITVGRLTVTVGTSSPVTMNGRLPGNEVHICIASGKVLRRIVMRPDLAMGEAYMDGTLTIINDDLDGLLALLMENSHSWRSHPVGRISLFFENSTAFLKHWNPVPASRRNVAHHYDLTDVLFDSFLDPRRQYSCAYYEHPDTDLKTAQETKIARIAAKLNLQPHDSILDIGCGWGGLSAALLTCEPSAHVTGITLSKQQLAFAQDSAITLGLTQRLNFNLRDYRDQRGQFDKIVSVGMLEHVGPHHLKTYFGAIKQRLAPGGIALIHSIAVNDHPAPVNRWIQKYIFPGGYLPSLDQIINAVTSQRIKILDMEIMRTHYADTLRDWRMNFLRNIDTVKAVYDDRFIRMWLFYLVGCEQFFRSQQGMVFQLQIAHDHHAAPINRRYIGELQDKYREILCRTSPSGKESS